MPTKPMWTKLILDKFGKNPNGESIYRVVWSEDRTEYRFGELKRKYGDGRNRWILEKWCPPSQYGTREEWEAAKDPETGVSILGPFPSNGDYEHSYTFESDGEFVAPTIGLVELIARCIERGRWGTRSERWAAIKKVKEDSDKAYKAKFDEVWKDAQGPFEGNPVSGNPGKRKPEDVELKYTTADLPGMLPQKTGFKQFPGE